MNGPESRERIEVNRREIAIEDRNGDRGRETRVEYADGGFVATGKIESGPNAGKAWVKGKGGVWGDRSIDAVSTFGLSANVDESSIGDWGYMIQGGQQADQPRPGDTWLKTRSLLDRTPDRVHGDERLVDRGVDRETDELGRTTYEKKTFGEKVMVLVTTYDDEAGFSVTTGKHIAGPESGKTWETRSVLKSPDGRDRDPSLQPTGAAGQTPEGTIDDLVLRGVSRDLDVTNEERSLMTAEQQAETRQRLGSTAYLELAGRWTPRQSTDSSSA